MISISKEKINSYLMALYIFQFGFLQPIASLTGSQWPVAALTIVLLLVALFNNNFKIRQSVLVIFLLVSIYFLFSTITTSNNMILILGVYFEFVIKSFSAVIIASTSTNGRDLYRAFLKIALLNFISIGIFPFTDFLTSMNYMRFGYAMLPSVMMFLYAVINEEKKKLGWILLTIISTLLTIIYGSRGPLLVLFIFVGLLFLFSKNIKKRIKTLIFTFGSLFTYLALQFQIIPRILDYLYFNLNIRSYSLAKFRLQLSEGLMASSSGRDRIYERILDLMVESPWFGRGIGIIQAELGFTSHNIFLQILIESGIFGLILWIIFWIYLGKKYYKMTCFIEDGYFKIASLIIASALGRLLISSDFWLRPEYWFGISMILNNKYIKLQDSGKL